MTGTKLTVKAIAAMRGQKVKAFALDAGIGVKHLYNVSAGSATLTAFDLQKICALTGLDADQIYCGKG